MPGILIKLLELFGHFNYLFVKIFFFLNSLYLCSIVVEILFCSKKKTVISSGVQVSFLQLSVLIFLSTVVHLVKWFLNLLQKVHFFKFINLIGVSYYIL